MCLIFCLKTCLPRGLNASFEFRESAKRNFQILNFDTWYRGATHNEHCQHFTDEGHRPKMSGHLLQFWHFQQHSTPLFSVFAPSVLVKEG